jgi:prolyl oligopeptidase PreP (S9A serine peptidase family)
MQIRWQRSTPHLSCAAADPPPCANVSAVQADGNLRSVLPLPGIGSVNGFSGQRKHSQAFFKFTSFTEPGAIYRRAMTSRLLAMCKGSVVMQSCASLVSFVHGSV